MGLITKGMGAVLKSIKTLKKSKKFPGSKAHGQLIKKIKSRKITKDRAFDVHERIGRTQRERDITATKIKEFRKDKGRFTGMTTNSPGQIQRSPFFKPGSKVVSRDGVAILLKAGDKKKDLRKFKEFIKTGTRRK